MAEHRGVTVEDLRRVVGWLDSEQAPDAVVSHHGVGTKVGEFRVVITPTSPSGKDRTGTVLVFELLRAHRQTDWRGYLVNGIDPVTRDALEAIVAEVAPVISAWNGLSEQSQTCSFNIDRAAGPGVARAYANYVPFKITGPAVVGIPAPDQPAAA